MVVIKNNFAYSEYHFKELGEDYESYINLTYIADFDANERDIHKMEKLTVYLLKYKLLNGKGKLCKEFFITVIK